MKPLTNLRVAAANALSKLGHRHFAKTIAHGQLSEVDALVSVLQFALTFARTSAEIQRQPREVYDDAIEAVEALIEGLDAEEERGAA